MSPLYRAAAVLLPVGLVALVGILLNHAVSGLALLGAR